MNIFRIQVTLQDGRRLAGVGYFTGNDEALNQTWADYPGASAISAINLSAKATSRSAS